MALNLQSGAAIPVQKKWARQEEVSKQAPDKPQTEKMNVGVSSSHFRSVTHHILATVFCLFSGAET